MEEGTKLVLDASFILAFLLPDEDIVEVEETFKKFQQKEIRLLSSSLLPFEVFNCLKTALLRKRMQFKLASALGEKFLQMDISLQEVDFTDSLKLSQKANLSFYDASYVYLARSEGVPLLTLDVRMKHLAQSA